MALSQFRRGSLLTPSELAKVANANSTTSVPRHRIALVIPVDDVRVAPSASPLTDRAVARMAKTIDRGVYRYASGRPPGSPAYETWSWLNAIVRASAEPQADTPAASDVRKMAQALREKTADLDAASARAFDDKARQLDEEADAIAERTRKRGRGRPADPRRSVGGLGGFVLALRGDDRDPAMSFDEIVDLIYAAPRDWLPRAPITEQQLVESGWLHVPRDRRDARAECDLANDARLRLRAVLAKLASEEAKAQGISRPRGGKRR